MCGFIGQISLMNDPHVLNGALPWLKRRGPDSQRLWQSDDARVSVLHARLAIVDQDERAHQPVTDSKQQVTVALVGEIYNYEELKREFSKYSYRTTSDTEVILALYEVLGYAGFSYLKGMFSFALVDEKQKKLFLVRDSIGKKPLYVASLQDRILFGTNVLSFCAVADRDLTPNPEGEKSYFLNSYVDPDKSMFKEVSPLLPGDVWQYDWQAKVTQKHRLCYQAQITFSGEKEKDVQRIIEGLYRQAVEVRLKNTPLPSLLLSGGIDSTTVAMQAAGLFREKGMLDSLKTYTLQSLIPGTQDEPYARYAAQKMGLSLSCLRLSGGRISQNVQRAINHQDEPLGMISFFFLFLLVEKVSEYSKILLTGDGGDEAFLGYGETTKWLNPSWDRQQNVVKSELGIQVPPWLSSWGSQAITKDLVGHGFSKIDRAAAEQGVEIRCPLLDVDLLTYLRSLPPEFFFGVNKISKNLLKQTLHGWPRWFTERKKIGFGYNLRWLWFLTNYDGCREMVGVETAHKFEHYLPAALIKKTSQWSALDIFNHFPTVWKLIAWQLFLQRVKDARNFARE